MDILFVASEASPYYHTGGVADVVFGLAKELSIQGNDVRIVVPRYRVSKRDITGTQIIEDKEVYLGAYFRSANLLKLKVEGSPIFYLVEQDFYFGRDDFYGYADDHERFIFFTRFALEMLSDPGFQEKEKWFPQIIQGFDWVTGMIPCWLPEYRTDKNGMGGTDNHKPDKRFNKVRFSLFVHNIRRLGKFGGRALALSEQEQHGIYEDIGEDLDQINFLGRGLLFADQIIMANPYFGTPENPLPETAESIRNILENRLAESEKSISGIPSGLDCDEYNPANDPAIITFNPGEIEKRIQNKLALQKELGFKQDRNIPLLGMVSRLIPENGFELLYSLEKHKSTVGDVQLAILAEPGDIDYQGIAKKWEAEQPWIKSRFAYDEKLARMIYAGCDIYLMPAKELPSGMQQLIAMHYGAIPVAHNTGTICKTILSYEPGMKINLYKGQGKGLGFKFNEYSGDAFLQALKLAIQTYRSEPIEWQKIQLFNLREIFSWDKPAGIYMDVYDRLGERTPRNVHKGKLDKSSKDVRLLQALEEIGNLPGMAKRSSSAILKQAARLVRWVLSCDAVYVRDLGKRLQLSSGDTESVQMGILEKSLNNTGLRTKIPDDNLVATLLIYSTNNRWRHLGDVDREGICQPLLGLNQHKVALEQGWIKGWSIPILAHGRLLGWIDALFTEVDDETWIVSSLTSMANSFGLRLDTVRIASETDMVSLMGTDFLGTHSVDEVVEKARYWIKKLIPDSQAWICKLINGTLQPTNNTNAINHSGNLAKRALDSNSVVYVADWSEAPRGENEHRLYRSVLAIPISPYLDLAENKTDSVLVVVSEKAAAFSRDDEQFLSQHLTPQIYAAFQKASWIEAQDSRRVLQLQKLVDSLVAGVDFNILLQKVVDTIADVLEVRAAALYLLDEETQLLEIRAAYGYQKVFLENKVVYSIGEGLTGWIAEQGKLVNAKSLEELHGLSGWQGSFNKRYKVPEPNAFLGIPLVIRGPEGAQKVIGVLKVEDRKESHPKTFFGEEDVHLGEMMANVIATMVYNAQKSEKRLYDFSANLRELSDVLVGSRDMPTLMDNIIKKIADVLHVDAASLYLADEEGTELIIQAAAGYQKSLVDEKVKYKWGQGVTGTIAATKKPVVTKSLEELRKIGGATSGTYDGLHVNRQQPQSFYGLPLVVKEKDRAIGVLKVESIKELFFSSEDVLLIEMMANVIATVVYNAQQDQKRLRNFSVSLRELSDVLVGSRDMPTLMDNIIKKIADVLHVDAASLYLADEEGTELIIQAAAGYQKSLVDEKVKYKWGQGVTGTIAATKKPVVTKSLEELRKIGGATSGTYDGLHVNRQQPQSFYGLPLAVKEKDRAIGVLKVESIKELFFSSEDVLLIEMMANVIATVVYNAQQGEKRLRNFSVSLRELSDVLAGSRDMPTLMDNIIKKIADVLHVDAASLYLADEEGTELIIQAAAGYQKSLVDEKVKYKWGQGVTGTIAATKKPVVTKSLEELRKIGGATSGTYDGLHVNRQQPQSFYGLPLVVKEKKQAIGVLKVESTKQRFFSNEDVLLIEMMANVIARMVYNARQSEQRIDNILKWMGSLSTPTDNIPALLRELAHSSDASVLHQFGLSIASTLDKQPQNAQREAQLLFDANAEHNLFRWIADSTSNDEIRWQFSLFHNVLTTSPTKFANWNQIMNIAEPWLRVKQNASKPDEFGEAVKDLVSKIAAATQLDITDFGIDSSETWFGTVLDTEKLFGMQVERIPILFHREQTFKEDDLERMQNLAQRGLRRPYQVLILVTWDAGLPEEQIRQIQARMRIHAIDVVVAGTADILQILGSPSPGEALRSLVLRQMTTTSPFVIVGPVPDAMFFGRERELREIIKYVGAERSVMVIGGRRIGKTSILARLYRVRLPEAGFRALYLDCSTIQDYQQFLSTRIREWRPEPPDKAIKTFGDLLQAPPVDKPLILLLDEADKLVPIDRASNWQLFNRLRDLTNSGQFKVVLSGERILREASHDDSSPLFNLFNELLLGRLEFDDVDELVSRPFHQLEIKLVDKNTIVHSIYDITSGHPNVVQRLCRRLIEHLNTKGGRQITPDDVDKIIDDPAFQRDDFLDTYFATATPLEKIIALLMANDLRVRTLVTVEEALAGQNLTVTATEIDSALQRLVDLRSILRRVPDGYQFAVEAFPRVVTGRMTSKDMLRILKEEYSQKQAAGEVNGYKK